jgi:GWxTD domain-containing protein
VKSAGLRLVALLMAATTVAVGQPRGEPIFSRPWDIRDYLSATPIWTPDSTAKRIDVSLRIARSIFIALKNTDGDPAAPFRRLGEITIELADSTNTVQARRIEKIDLPAQQAEDVPGKFDWLQKQFTFTVPPGSYQVRAELYDLQSRNRVVKSQPVRTLRSPSGDSLFCSAAFLYTSQRAGEVPDTLHPQNFGNGILFSTPGGILLEILGGGALSGNATIVYRMIVEEREERIPWRSDTLKAAPLRSNVSLKNTETAGYTLEPSPPGPSRAFVLLPLPLEKLPLRKYRLDIDVEIGGRRANATVPIFVLWPDQPESMRDVDYALESLRFIVREDVLDSLTRGTFEARRDNLENFWRPRDPTPETADNPLMTEYYRRIDAARTQFATLKQRDGTKTDRGRIFVLYGPPGSSERSLDPGTGFTETWSYPRLKKRFVFKDETRDGSYVLISTTVL